MKFFIVLLCAGLSASALVKREAEPEPNAEADADPSGYGRQGGYAAAPVCTLTPVKECNPRQVENPRQVCQTVWDLHEDTIVTENCEEVVTTQCTQTSQTAHRSSAIVDKSSRPVEAGVPHAVPVVPVVHAAPVAVAHHGGYGGGHGNGYGKREATAEADATPEADAEGYYGGRRSHVAPYVAAHPVVSAPAKSISPPVCQSVPVKQCENIPVSTPRKVARTVCDTIVDITTIEDCHETVTKHCQQTSTSHSSHSAVVGHDSKVIATAVEVPHGHHAGAGYAGAGLHAGVGHAGAGHAGAGHAGVGHAGAGRGGYQG